MPKNLVLVLNCGSSSIKFALVNPISNETVWNGIVQAIANEHATFTLRDGIKHEQNVPNISYQAALDLILTTVHKETKLFQAILAIGHRVVHGDEYFTKSTIIDDQVLASIYDCRDLAPLHNPANILGIEAARKAFPHIPQVAVFDTAFHQTMPKYAFMYAVSYELYRKHRLRRYGFHGTSHRFVAQKAADLLDKPYSQCNFITAHLGNGCSICAIAKGQSVDTSMGLTPLEGLVMGTRSGDVDPGLHAHLVDMLGYDIHKVNELLNKQSGLLGISELSSDMREIEQAIEQGHEQASLAADIFCYRLAKYIGSFIVPVGKVDALIFTGGIGENSSYIRAKTLEWLAGLGFYLDSLRNDVHGKHSGGLITTDNSHKAFVIPTNEELMIAKDAWQLISP